jgi:hypothetical protein
MTRVAHTLDINLRRGHLACELSDQSIFGSIGDALYQLNDLFCEDRVGKTRDA